MTSLPNAAAWPEDFSGRVKLFPLPNLVLFPHVVQPLHIFEPRYCDMLTAALEQDGLIAMALFRAGWESSYLNSPTLEEIVCIGKVISHTPTEDGRHNILLVGMKRATIIRELTPARPYREAQVDLLEDLYPSEGEAERPGLVDRVQELFAHFVPEGLAAQESFKQLIGKQLPLGILTDTIAYALNLPLPIKQQLLSEANVDVRCRLLIRCLEQKIKAPSDGSASFPEDDFPPRFSEN
ncbi:LON peptidase substrate-binding domain-containing protein [Aureliella helgolandensis]|uniref:Lon protease n=1 Tax=Aureliella helgolandensis TaxID=2527968 RepID=A0A518G761_9BACT|nr:LON peptidase substrate-binding domain-containing protein [Aureliella helgolandensis]QDV24429.1 Lon protease [Aureliella helgolandensis]